MRTFLVSPAVKESQAPRSKASLAWWRPGERQEWHNRSFGLIYVPDHACKISLHHRRVDLTAGQFLLVMPGRQMSSVPSADGLGLLFLQLDLPTLSAWRQQDPSRREGIFPGVHTRPDFCEQSFSACESPLGKALTEVFYKQESTFSPNDWATLLIQQQWEVHQQLERITSAKLSTRQDLYRRLCQSRRYMLEHLHLGLDLDTLAQVACLSKYHFIRLFKEVYGQTPRQYLISRRLERASTLLLSSNLSFHDICQEVGLKDSSSFGRLFKRSFGATPQLYRQQQGV